MKPRGPTILAIAAFVAVMALVSFITSTGTASAAELPLHANAGFVTADGTDLQAQLVTSNTSADPTANLISRDPSGLVMVNPGLELTGYGSQLHEDQVVFGSNVTISAVTDPNNTTGPAGGLQAVLTNIGSAPPVFNGGKMFSERVGAAFAGNLGTSTPKELLTPKDQVVSGLDVTISAGIDPNGATDTAAGMTLTRSTGFKAAILFGVLALAMIAGARTATRGR